MTTRRPSRVRRFISFVFFRFLPLISLGMTVWLSTGIVQAFVNRASEQSNFEAQRSRYAETAVAIAPTLVTTTPTITPSPIPSATPTITASATGTFTATASSTSSPTLTITSSPTYTASATASPMVVAQAFATNTPRSQSFSFPATNTQVLSPAPSATDTPTLTLPPPPTEVPAASNTPRPLPQLILPPEPNLNAAAPTAIPTQVPALDRQGNDLVNIVLLGTDGEITNDGFERTDTMIVVSINRTTGTVAMLSLPRDLFVYIPGWTMQRLNLAYARGENIGWDPDGGWGLLRQTIFYNFGINVHYYAMINLSGFKDVIDTLGGVNIAVDCAIQDLPLVDAPPPPESIPNDEGYYTLPVGYYTFDGGSALWYARSRHSSIEFDRGRRQQQILRAILRKARDGGQLIRLPELWSQITDVAKTNLALEDVIGLLPYGLNLDPDRIETFYFNRLYHTTPWTPPDGANVQLPVYDTMRQLLEDFYTPPTINQAEVQLGSIEVLNGTTHASWDRVAAEQLGWSGYPAVPAGQAELNNQTNTIIYDYTGATKGSIIEGIAETLRVSADRIISEPDANRTVDYRVVLGEDYDSCTSLAVIDVEAEGG